MIAWGWRGAAMADDVARTLLALAKRRGLQPLDGDARRGAILLRVATVPSAVVVLGSALAGREVAAELSRTLGVAGRYAEVDLEDTRVSATAHALAADGTIGAEEDLDELVQELCHEWFEDRKYLAEGHDDLVCSCLEIDGELARDARELWLGRSGSRRVLALVDAIRVGARWEPTTVGERRAIRVIEATSTRVAVLTDDELAELERELARDADEGAGTR